MQSWDSFSEISSFSLSVVMCLLLVDLWKAVDLRGACVQDAIE